MEDWRVIPDFPNYAVSDTGLVKNLKTGRILRPGVHRQGYLLVWLSDHGLRYGKSIHRLVTEAFIPNPDGKSQVNHKDGNKTNNHVDNLEWSTGSENTLHAYRTGLFGGRPRVPVRIVETGEIFESIRECAIAINGSSGDICSCLHGEIESYRGLHFEMV